MEQYDHVFFEIIQAYEHLAKTIIIFASIIRMKSN